MVAASALFLIPLGVALLLFLALLVIDWRYAVIMLLVVVALGMVAALFLARSTSVARPIPISALTNAPVAPTPLPTASSNIDASPAAR